MTFVPLRSLFALLALCLSLDACAAGPSKPYVELKGKMFAVELAEDSAAQERGLMFRESMDHDRGMLFIFENVAPRSFWMANTKIPLDMLYFDGDRKLVSVQQRVPPCRSAPPQCPSYSSTGPARYVLELNAGLADELGVKPGDEFQLHR